MYVKRVDVRKWGGVRMEETYKKLDKSKLKNRKRTTAATEDSLKDIVPIQWSEDVMNGVRPVGLSVSK